MNCTNRTLLCPKKPIVGGVSDADFAPRHHRLWNLARHRGQRPLPQDLLGKATGRRFLVAGFALRNCVNRTAAFLPPFFFFFFVAEQCGPFCRTPRSQVLQLPACFAVPCGTILWKVPQGVCQKPCWVGAFDGFEPSDWPGCTRRAPPARPPINR